MGLGGILILLLLLVSLIAFIYIVVKTARGWGVLHTILLCFLFIECWVFMIFSAGVQYRRVRDTARADKAEKDAMQVIAQRERLLYGTLETRNSLEAVIPVKGMLRRITAGRGRVWRRLAFLQGNQSEYQLEMLSAPAVADPLADDAAATATPMDSQSLPVDLVVYAFAEEIDDEGRPSPTFYLGEFNVTRSQAGQITLTPTIPLLNVQAERIASGAAPSWMLYELLPIDSHEAFAAEGSEPSEDFVFGRMEEETIQNLLAGLPDSNRDKIIDSYLRDGSRANENDPAENIWYEVNVAQTIELDVDSQEEANATIGGYFDNIGRAVDGRLKRTEEEGPAKLTADMNSELILFSQASAQELIEKGLLEPGFTPHYVRPLNDYEEAFNRNGVRSHEMAEQIKVVARDTEAIKKAGAMGTEMINFRQVENQKLSSDLTNYQKEIAVLQDAVQQANDELLALKSNVSRLYKNLRGAP